MEPDKYTIDEPLLYDSGTGEWAIFNGVIPDHILTADCNDTVVGHCIYEKTLEDCVEICEKSGTCQYGYHITSLPNHPDTCVPIHTIAGNANPVYRLRNKSIYEPVSRADVQTFMSTKVSFPPHEGNVVFYEDSFMLGSQNNHLASPTMKGSSDTLLLPDGDLHVILLAVPIRNDSTRHYVPVKFGDNVVINIPSTTLVVSSQSDGALGWVPGVFNIDNRVTFTLTSPDASRTGTPILYSDSIYMMIDKDYVAVSNGTLVVGNNPTVFNFRPQMKGYYCDQGTCNEMHLTDMRIRSDGVGVISGSDGSDRPIMRNPGCWGVCSYSPAGENILDNLYAYTHISDNWTISVICIAIAIAVVFWIIRTRI